MLHVLRVAGLDQGVVGVHVAATLLHNNLPKVASVLAAFVPDRFLQNLFSEN